MNLGTQWGMETGCATNNVHYRKMSSMSVEKYSSIWAIWKALMIHVGLLMEVKAGLTWLVTEKSVSMHNG